MKDIIDTKFIGWMRTILWCIRPLNPICYGVLHTEQRYVALVVPSLKLFYYNILYIKNRTDYCAICNSLIPTWQYGSSEGSFGQHCAQCEERHVNYDKRKP